MYCTNCGKELRETAKFCPYCGSRAETNAEDIPAEAVQDVEESPVDVEENPVDNTEEKPISEADEKASEESEPAAEASGNISEGLITDRFDEKDGFFIVKPAETVTETAEAEIQPKRKIPPFFAAAAVSCIILICVCAFVIPNYAVPEIRYRSAERLYQNGEFEKASAVFSVLDGYKDSADYISKCGYGAAEKLFADGLFPEAADAFTALDGYSDSDEKALECMLKIAENYINEGNYDAAMSVYAAAGKSELAEQTALEKIGALAESGDYFGAAEIAEKYCDSSVVAEYRYLGASSARESGDYKTAADNFYRLGDYKDSAELAKQCTYSFYNSEYAQKGVSEEIVRGFYFLGDFRNSSDMFVRAAYEYGLKCMENGDYPSAAAMFKNSGTYKDSAAMLYKARYELGKSLTDSDPASARSVFALLSTYADSSAQKKAAADKLPDDHENWYADGITSAGGYYTTVFRKNDVLLVSCNAGTDSISAPISFVLTFTDSSGLEISADCENVRNSGSFSGSFSLSSAASGSAEITISRKDNGAVLRTIEITVAE
ncbi:MAG: zinc-ribbon domain-containing protein [Oscillospiraceae bacterium]